MADGEDRQLQTNKTTKIVIISSITDEQERLLSRLNPENVEKFLVELSASERRSTTEEQISKSKKRKADLTCVVCEGQAIGYNFGQIACESCKAFFRRNALQPSEKLKCSSNDQVRCSVRYDTKQKCPRCRLFKCFRAGMRKDFILTTEEKQSKKQRLEENRRLRSTDLPAKLVSPSALTEADWTCLNDLRRAYTTATQSSPSASSMLSLNLAPDKMSAFMNTLDIQNFTAVKLINFLREVPEFSELNDGDRLILVKYNLTLLFIVRHSLTFDSNREIYYDLDSTGAVSPAEEAFAHHCKSLFILCFGYEFNQAAMSLLHALVALVNRDPLVVQLLMLIMIFSKGLSADDDQQPILLDPQSVFRAQSKYTDLLFRYLMENNAFERVIDKMTRITELLLKIQRVSRDFQQYLKSKVDLTHVNPLMKSLLHLT